MRFNDSAGSPSNRPHNIWGPWDRISYEGRCIGRFVWFSVELSQECVACDPCVGWRRGAGRGGVVLTAHRSRGLVLRCFFFIKRILLIKSSCGLWGSCRLPLAAQSAVRLRAAPAAWATAMAHAAWRMGLGNVLLGSEKRKLDCLAKTSSGCQSSDQSSRGATRYATVAAASAGGGGGAAAGSAAAAASPSPPTCASIRAARASSRALSLPAASACRRNQKGSEGFRRIQKDAEGCRRMQKDSSAGFRRIQEESGGVRRSQKEREGIRVYQKAPEGIRRHPKASEGTLARLPRALRSVLCELLLLLGLLKHLHHHMLGLLGGGGGGGGLARLGVALELRETRLRRDRGEMKGRSVRGQRGWIEESEETHLKLGRHLILEIMGDRGDREIMGAHGRSVGARGRSHLELGRHLLLEIRSHRIDCCCARRRLFRLRRRARLLLLCFRRVRHGELLCSRRLLGRHPRLARGRRAEERLIGSGTGGMESEAL